jgi:eukaryotic-like serine/threonine-protein kinase
MRKCVKCGRFFEKGAYCPDDWIPLIEVPQDLSGSQLVNYKLLRPLGKGGMGTVYLGENVLIKRRVAIKLLHQDLARDRVTLQRFFTEAQVVNKIGHENIVDVIDLQQLEDGTTFLVMEHLTGESLGALIRRAQRLDANRTLHIAIQSADALAAAHTQGVLHRDLKPDNIFITTKKTERDFVKILDFGLAKLLDKDPPDSDKSADPSLTGHGHTVGTPYYMAPEQCEGKRDIDARADIYALGVILYHCLSGRLPFDGSLRGNVMLEHLCDPVPPLRSLCPDLSTDVEQIVDCALEKEKERRFGSMEAMAQVMRKARQRLELSVGGRSEIPQKKPLKQQPPPDNSWDTIPEGLATVTKPSNFHKTGNDPNKE